MPVVNLTDATIRSLKASSVQVTYHDKNLAGFGCRVTPSGTKVYVLVHGADRRRTTIGRVGIIALAEARTEAKRILAEKTLGKERPRSLHWDEAVTEFLAYVEKSNKPRTHRDYKRLLNRHFAFGRVKLSEIMHSDIERKLKKLDRVPSERYHALSAVKIFLSWAKKPPRHYIQNNPSEGMENLKRPSCTRVLSGQELRIVWKAANEATTFHSIVRLCILLGQRPCAEIGAIRAEFINWNERTITWPDTKNNRPHTIPFGPLAEAILKTLPSKGFLFPARYTSEESYRGWSKNKRELDATYGKDVAPYTLKDLRRTAATGWANLGIAPHVVERLLNHTFGSIMNKTDGVVSVVAEIYNRATYIPEMRCAMAAWETHIETLISTRQSQAA